MSILSLFAAAVVVASPDGNLTATFSADKTWRAEWRGKAVVEESRLGLDLDNEVWEMALGKRDLRQYDCWMDGLEFAGSESKDVADDPWSPLWGERSAASPARFSKKPSLPPLAQHGE